MIDLVVCVGEGAKESDAELLARRVNAPLTNELGSGLTLLMDRTGLSLAGYGLRYQGNFEQMLPRISRGRLGHEMLIRVAKPKGPGLKAIDAAAGMGEDALLLAAAGYEVTMYERNAVIAALLRDAMERAKENALLKDIVERMHLTEGNSTELMPKEAGTADIVYLDPMFPPRQKTGLVNKKLQLIQKLEQPCVDERAMLDAALSVRPKKIIIKRPLKGAYLAGAEPNYTVKGKAIRYDCFAFPDRFETDEVAGR